MLRGAVTVFLSGFSVMVVELVAGRLVAPFFGQSTRTWAALTGVTLAGCTLGNALGGWLSGALRGRLRRGLAVVLVLSAVGVAGLPFLLPSLSSLGLVGFVVAGWLPVTLVLGCVSPLVAAMCVRSEANGRDLGFLYFFSMLGSALGSALGGLLLPFVLPAPTVYLALGAVLLVAVVFVPSAWGQAALPGDAAAGGQTLPGDAAAAGGQSLPRERQPLLFLAAFAVGWFGMGVELAGVRLVTPILGGNHLVWSLVFVTFIGLMGLGGGVGGRLADRVRRPEAVAVSLFVLAAGAVGTVLLVTRVLPSALLTSGPVLRLLGFTVAAFAPLAFLLGAASTVVLRFATARALALGDRRVVGYVYAVSSLGCVLGTFVTGFACVGRINSSALILLQAAALVAVATWLSRKTVCGCVVLAAFALLLPEMRAQLPTEVTTDPGRTLVASVESRYNAVTVSGYAEFPNRRTIWLDRIAHTEVDLLRRTRLVSAYTRMLDAVVATRGPRRLFMIGGGGYALPRKWTSAGCRPWERLVVAEIDAAVQTAAAEWLDAMPEVTNGVEYVTDDGRAVLDRLLGTEAGTYDVVIGDTISDAAIPYHLVTKEFNDRVKRLLKKEGVYLVHTLDVAREGELLKTLMKTLGETFAHVGAFSYDRLDDVRHSFVIVATDDPAAADVSVYAAKLQGEHPDALPFVWDRGTDGGIVLTDAFAPVERFVWKVIADASDKRSERLTEDGMALISAGEAAKAWPLVEEALRLAPENGDALHALRRYVEDCPDDARAFGLLKKQAERPSCGFQAKAEYASVLMQCGRKEEAAGIFRELARRFPDHPDFRTFRERPAAGAQKGD